MKEANDSYTSIHMFRKLFTSILLKCEVSNHKEFYQKCKELLDTDYIHKYRTEFKNHPLLSRYVSKDWTAPVGFEQNIGGSDSSEWTVETIASNSALCELENMLSEEDKSLSDFKLPLPDFHKEQFIQNCLMDCYVANEDDLLPERAKLYLEANHNKLNQDQKRYLITSKD